MPAGVRRRRIGATDGETANREEEAMYPGLRDADCRANEERFRQMRLDAACRRLVATADATDGGGCHGRATPVRETVGLLAHSVSRLVAASAASVSMLVRRPLW
jgi:hypothetical protein